MTATESKVIEPTRVSVTRHAGEVMGFGSGNAYHIAFDGAGDMVRTAMAGADRRDLYDFHFFNRAGFIGRDFSTFEEITRAVDSMWTHGIDRIEEMSRELERENLPKPTVVRRRRVWDDYAGDEIDVDRYRSADPYFRDTVRARTSGPRLISFLVQLGQNAWMESDALFWRGALAITLARIIEDAGYRSEITAFTMGANTVSGPTPHVLSSVRLKEAGDPLDIGSLVNVTSGWFFRTVMFASWTAPGEKLNGGLGQMVEAGPKAVEFLAPQSKPWLISAAYDKESALALARKLLAELVHENR